MYFFNVCGLVIIKKNEKEARYKALLVDGLLHEEKIWRLGVKKKNWKNCTKKKRRRTCFWITIRWWSEKEEGRRKTRRRVKCKVYEKEKHLADRGPRRPESNVLYNLLPGFETISVLPGWRIQSKKLITINKSDAEALPNNSLWYYILWRWWRSNWTHLSIALLFWMPFPLAIFSSECSLSCVLVFRKKKLIIKFLFSVRFYFIGVLVNWACVCWNSCFDDGSEISYRWRFRSKIYVIFRLENT